ncbi:TorF family putative porin [Massilia sp. MS-15]|uniref:TorF family putative porin n=1 Tax=Massilia sp. MS-15 TaxID=2878200 RepID=UPI001CD6E7D7|nr:TorF family putative porin [Massilia sp. MS-15]MCA1248108.1 TorF family putative porin [Massilia sp. MS-15]
MIALLRRLLPVPLLLLALPAVQAGGQETAPATTVTATVTLASQYVSRGMRQSWGRPALQAGVDVVHPSGWSAGTWTSTVSERFIEGGRVEWDLYGGYAGALGPVDVSLMAMHYRYPGARIGATGTRYDYTELVPGLGFGPFYAKYYRTVSRDFFGITDARGTGYLDLGFNYDLGSGFTLNLHLGDGRVAGAGNAIWDWRDAKAGVTRTFDGGWSIAAAYTRAWGATDAYDRYTTGVPRASGEIAVSNPAKGTFAVSLARTF